MFRGGFLKRTTSPKAACEAADLHILFSLISKRQRNWAFWGEAVGWGAFLLASFTSEPSRGGDVVLAASATVGSVAVRAAVESSLWMWYYCNYRVSIVGGSILDLPCVHCESCFTWNRRKMANGAPYIPSPPPTLLENPPSVLHYHQPTTINPNMMPSLHYTTLHDYSPCVVGYRRCKSHLLLRHWSGLQVGTVLCPSAATAWYGVFWTGSKSQRLFLHCVCVRFFSPNQRFVISISFSTLRSFNRNNILCLIFSSSRMYIQCGLCFVFACCSSVRLAPVEAGLVLLRRRCFC